jgi:hypothetical protein
VLLVRRIRDLLYEQGFTISGARHRLDETGERQAPTEVSDIMPPVLDKTMDLVLLRREIKSVLELLQF